LHDTVFVSASADRKVGEHSKHLAQEMGKGTFGGDFLLPLVLSCGVNNTTGSVEIDMALLLIELATLLLTLALLSLTVLVAGKLGKDYIENRKTKFNIRIENKKEKDKWYYPVE
jgi:hypothetical protein